MLDFGKVDIGPVFRQSCRLSYDFLKECSQPLGSYKFYCWRNLIAIRLSYLFSYITGRDFDSLRLLKKINEKRAIRLTGQQWQQLVWLWYEPLGRLAWIEPNLPATLASLKQLQLKLGIVTNTFISASSLERHLKQVGILDFFTVRLYSYEFDFRKPDVRIFEAAAERIREKITDIMFVGDRLDNDIKPALKLGMYAVLKSAYTNNGQKIPIGVLKINRLSELPALIQRINAEAGF